MLFHLKEYNTNVKIVDDFQKQLELISLIKEFNVKGNTLTVEQKIEQEITILIQIRSRTDKKKQSDFLNLHNEKTNIAIAAVATHNGYTHISDKKNYCFNCLHLI